MVGTDLDGKGGIRAAIRGLVDVGLFQRFNVTYVATYTHPLGNRVPKGWQTYSFPVDADSPTVPKGWKFTHGDGTPAGDAEWSQFLKQVDLTTVGYYRPGFAYPSLGSWNLGIDNITLKAMPKSG